MSDEKSFNYFICTGKRVPQFKLRRFPNEKQLIYVQETFFFIVVVSRLFALQP